LVVWVKLKYPAWCLTSTSRGSQIIILISTNPNGSQVYNMHT
jgi:hypothetical protein